MGIAFVPPPQDENVRSIHCAQRRSGGADVGSLGIVDPPDPVSIGDGLESVRERCERSQSPADTLRIHADGLRVQRTLRAEEQASKAPLKMMFPTLFIFAATLLVTIGPGLLQLMGFFNNR